MFGLLLLIPASIALGYLITYAFFPGVSKRTFLERDERRFYALGISMPAVLFGLFFVGQFAGINYTSLIVSYALIAALSYGIYRKRRVLLPMPEKKAAAIVTGAKKPAIAAFGTKKAVPPLPAKKPASAGQGRFSR